MHEMLTILVVVVALLLNIIVSLSLCIASVFRMLTHWWGDTPMRDNHGKLI